MKVFTSQTIFKLKKRSRLFAIFFFSVPGLGLSYRTGMTEGLGLIPAKAHSDIFRVSPSHQ